MLTISVNGINNLTERIMTTRSTIVMAMAALCLSIGAVSADDAAVTTTTDAEPTGLLGDLLDDLIDKDKDKDDKPEPKPDAPSDPDDGPGIADDRHADHDPKDVPYHDHAAEDRHRIKFKLPERARRWEHGVRNYVWHWDEQTARGRVRFELWRGRKRIAEIKPPVENDGAARLTDPVSDKWGSGRNYYIVAIDARNRVGVSERFTMYGGVLVDYPTEATVWQVDAKGARINWDRATAKGNSVDIELYKGDKRIATLRERTPNDGEAAVNGVVKEAWGGGEGYRVRVTDPQGRSGWSDTFRINIGVAVLHPNKDTQWRLPIRNQVIRWDRTSARGGKVDIELWKADKRIAVIRDGATNDGEATIEKYDSAWGTGDDYHVRVIDQGGQGRTGSSERFSVTTVIEVTKPGRGVSWPLGKETVQVKWRPETATGPVRFELWTSDRKKKLANFLDAQKNDGESHRPEGLNFEIEPGAYVLKAIDTSGSVGWSAPFKVTKPRRK